MAKQHKYTSAVTVTQNVARVEAINYYPNRAAVLLDGSTGVGLLEVVFAIGEEVGGVFTKTDTEVIQRAFADLPGGIQTTFDGLETTALTFGENQGIYPAGTEEPTP